LTFQNATLMIDGRAAVPGAAQAPGVFAVLTL